MNMIKEDISVPVVMTARSEFWRRKEVEFATSFGIKVMKGPRKVRPVRLVELREWGEAETLELIRRVRSEVRDEKENGGLGEVEGIFHAADMGEVFP